MSKKSSGRRTRRVFNAEFKAKVALAALREDTTWADLCQHELHPAQITEWKKQLLERASDVFGTAGKAANPVDLGPLHAKIGQQALEIDFLEGALTKAADTPSRCSQHDCGKKSSHRLRPSGNGPMMRYWTSPATKLD